MAKKILVLEDEEELGTSIKRFLQQFNYHVTYLSDISGVEPIRLEMPDLILTDLLMPRLHGFDLCRSVKEDPQLKDIPLIAMSAVYKDAFHKLEAMRIGMTDFLEKPFKFNDLLEKIEKHLGPAEPVEEKETAVIEAAIEPKETKKAIETREKSETMPPKVKPLTMPEEEEITREEEKRRDQMILEQFQEMKHDYSSHLPGKIIEIEQIWGRIQQGYDAKNELTKLRQKVHSLTGSGTTFGFSEISQYARQLELLLDMISVESEETKSQKKDKINELLDNMRHHPIVSTELEVIRQLKRK